MRPTSDVTLNGQQAEFRPSPSHGYRDYGTELFVELRNSPQAMGGFVTERLSDIFSLRVKLNVRIGVRLIVIRWRE